ncbi:Co2+/Mg2+ efflux protein ApaG [Sphingomonas sp. BIUV-7]|uniref:Protein ApaG n=1 Tax=Sphingomonas natans TaxID=3063330 RepID=A0ABT8Y571_9SPHN|nr:Co2+/Mg2+ efflux protein ApaG [Sphingomonas sp. BIUV-7]MDO6413467.1 Co2+/Mg2+ efflux protein ApaG [Sphingomonas sp. BIUV-7]
MLTDLLFPYVAETQSVIVRVSVSFLADQSQPERGRWFWSYHIRIENVGEQPVQLLSRRWIITDGHGARHRVEGEGVIGAQPVLAPGESYDYVSGCPLDTPTGSMEGTYRMMGADGESFEARIPRFALVGSAVAE